MNDYTHHIKFGILSGYPRCCILWYFMRLPYVHIRRYIWPFKGQPTGSYDLERSLYPHRHAGYCACPGHSLYYWVNNRRPYWYKCDKCDWSQIGVDKCRKCMYEKYKDCA